MLQPVAPSISANDTPYLPKLHLIQELTTADPYLANEQLVDVVGG
jgi:hypothetical protein